MDRVVKFVQSAISQGGVVLAVSIGIINAFNSLLWSKITTALAKHTVPQCLRDVINSYLSDRSIIYNIENGTRVVRKMTRGVPGLCS